MTGTVYIQWMAMRHWQFDVYKNVIIINTICRGKKGKEWEGRKNNGKEEKGMGMGRERNWKEGKGMGRKGKEWEGRERNGKDGKGMGRKGKEREGRERKGKEWEGRERKEKEGKGMGRRGKEWEGRERNGKEGKGMGRRKESGGGFKSSFNCTLDSISYIKIIYFRQVTVNILYGPYNNIV